MDLIQKLMFKALVMAPQHDSLSEQLVLAFRLLELVIIVMVQLLLVRCLLEGFFLLLLGLVPV